MKKRGRPRFDPAQDQKRRNINLSDSLADKARAIGNGNVSRGIRLALEQYEMMKLNDAIELAAAIAFEQDADQYVIDDDCFGWRVVHNEDPEAYAPGIVHRFLVHSDGVDPRHIEDGEITADWELPE